MEITQLRTTWQMLRQISNLRQWNHKSSWACSAVLVILNRAVVEIILVRSIIVVITVDVENFFEKKNVAKVTSSIQPQSFCAKYGELNQTFVIRQGVNLHMLAPVQVTEQTLLRR